MLALAAFAQRSGIHGRKANLLDQIADDLLGGLIIPGHKDSVAFIYGNIGASASGEVLVPDGVEGLHQAHAGQAFLHFFT